MLYKCFYKSDIDSTDADKSEGNEEEKDDLGGLFKLIKSKEDSKDRRTMNQTDCSKFFVESVQDWAVEEVCT